MSYDKETIEWLRKSAELGNAEEQNHLGSCYDQGKGVAKDLKEAVKWYRKAAEQGNAAAQFNIGACYEKGDGVKKDLNEAARWYRMSAEQGDADAQYKLGECFEKGRGITVDSDEAARWYRMSAEQGDADAQYKLGECFEKGRGVTVDSDEAARWYRLSAEQGNKDALRQIEWLVKNKGIKEAFNFISELAQEGDKEMQIFFAKCYEYGWAVAKDINEAAKWYRKFAEQGNAYASWRIESLAREGSEEAFSFLTQLAQQGDEKMQIFAAECCKNGWGVDKSLAKAVKWYRMAVEQGNKGALKSIFQLAMRGTKEAFDVLLALAQQNNIEALNTVGCCYERGNRSNRDINEAIKWYRKAAEHGDEKASANVQYCIEYGNKDSFSSIPSSTAAELSFREASPFIPIESFESSVTNPSGLLLSPDDRLVVIFHDEEPAMTVMFDTLTWKEKWRQQSSHISPQAFSPDGNFLLVCRKNGPTAAILDSITGGLVRELSGHTGAVTAAAWSSSNLIATGSDDKTICIFRADGTLVRVLTEHTVAFSYLAFANDGNHLFSNSLYYDGMRLWDVAAGTFRSLDGDEMKLAKVSPDGSLIVGVWYGGLKFFKANDFNYGKLSTSFRETILVTWSPDSKHLFAKNGRTLYFFHFTEEGPLCTSFHHATDISAMAFFCDGDRALTIDSEGRVQHHLYFLENSLTRTPAKPTASQFPLNAIPFFIPKPAHSVQEALDRTGVLIERTLLPTSLQNLQRVLQRINDSSVSGIHVRVRTENAIEDMFTQISKFIESESHPESAPESLKQSIDAIESAMQTLLSDSSSLSLPTSLSSFPSSKSNALFAEDPFAHAVPGALSKTELEVTLKFSHYAHNKLRALEKVLTVRAASFGDAIVEYDNFASELRAKSETYSDEFTELVAQMKKVINMISATDVNDVNAMDTSTSSTEINESAAASKNTENNQSIDKSKEDVDENDRESMIPLQEIRIPIGKVNDVKVSPDGNILAIAHDKGLFIFDTRSKVELWKITSWTWHIAFSPTSTQLAAAICTEEDVVTFDAATGKRVFRFEGDSGKAFRIAWSNSNLIASAHNIDDRHLCILVRYVDGKVYGRYCEDWGISDLSFSPDNTRMAVAAICNDFLIYDLCDQGHYDEDYGYFRSLPKIISDGKNLFRVAFSPDGSKVAYTSKDGAICVLDSNTLVKTNEFNFSGRVDIVWSRNSRFIAAISSGDYRNDYFFKILAADGNQFNESVFQQKILGDRVVAFSLDGSEIITVNQSEGLVQFWMSPLFITLITELMPSAEADNGEIPFGQFHVIPPIDTQPVEHIFDRTATLIDRVDHPESFYRLVTLLHQFRNVSANLKISESDADFLVIDSRSSSSSSSSSCSQQTRIRKSTFESMLDFVNVNGKKLLMLENKLLCRADMFSKALVAYDSFVDELRMASEKHLDKIAGFISYLSKPPMSADRIHRIRSTIAIARQSLQESSNQLSSTMAGIPASNMTVGQPRRPEEASSPENAITKRPRIEADQV